MDIKEKLTTALNLLDSKKANVSDLNQIDEALDEAIDGASAGTLTDLTTLISSKADKATSFTQGNFASIGANGSFVDSGHKHSDYLTSHQDISGKADKSEMSIVEGAGTATITLKNGTSATVLTRHQSLATVATTGSYNDLLDKPSAQQETRYAIVTPTVTTSTTDSSNDTISATLQDRAINIVSAGSGIDYVNLTFPAYEQGYARDFFVRLVLTGVSVPMVTFSEPGGGDVEFDVDDDSWTEIDLGVNLLMFTETSQA